MTLRVVSLFSGIGGLDLGLEQAGHKVVAQCEIDPHARKVLKRWWPDVPCHEDVRELTKYNWRLDEEQKQQAVRLYEIGLSCGDVATYYGVSRQSMWDVLRRRTQMRPQLRYGAENHFYRGGSTADDHAQNILEFAVRSGVVQRRTSCEKCGATGEMKDGRSIIQAHHPDYNRPLDVQWLCQSCHHQWHQDSRAVARRGGDANGSQPATVDVLAGGFP